MLCERVGQSSPVLHGRMSIAFTGATPLNSALIKERGRKTTTAGGTSLTGAQAAQVGRSGGGRGGGFSLSLTLSPLRRRSTITGAVILNVNPPRRGWTTCVGFSRGIEPCVPATRVIKYRS